MTTCSDQPLPAHADSQPSADAPLSIVAVIAAHNAASTLGRVLAHLQENLIDVVLIDHGSSDESSRLIEQFRGRPIARVIHEPFDGVFSLRRMLQLKEEVVAESDADWVIHMDADEIFESPCPGETLRQFIQRSDRGGYELIDCDEFVFCPQDEAEDYAGDDYVERMRHYYHFAPPARTLHRIVKRAAKTASWADHAGHRLAGNAALVAPEKARLRHYIGLSLDHLRSQYLGRVFAGDALARGWHGKRVAVRDDLIQPPEHARLLELDSAGLRTDRPQERHAIFRENAKYQAPVRLIPSTAHAPMPFVTGVGRSGTTLLRLMLDAHPDLAMTPETHWLRPALRHMASGAGSRDVLCKLLAEGRGWDDMGISRTELDVIVDAAPAEDAGATVRRIYATYARRFGAGRVGDKTPLHGVAMHDIASALPEARFIHIIRDGRDVAASYRGLWFGPGSDMRAMATMWMWRIRESRQQAQFLPHYLEVRFEDLVTETERELRRVGEFLDLPFHPAQLESHLRAESRLEELQDVVHKGGVVSAERRRGIFALTGSPPDQSRVGAWRTDLSPQQIDEFERVAGDMLTDLGYARSVPKKWWPGTAVH